MSKRQRRVGVHEAKTHLSRLLHEVEKGAEIVVVRGGRPVARIVAVGDATAPADSYGLFKGQFVMGDDFDADSNELADLFGIPR
jgi:prevent-host-death family protein